ncbi:hypothetical protein DFH06DRAFT_1317561 [Mycena polygramma]|nr:hypothetical protein DFH06DRAFT_1317561 [Mycena polygramma]
MAQAALNDSARGPRTQESSSTSSAARPFADLSLRTLVRRCRDIRTDNRPLTARRRFSDELVRRAALQSPSRHHICRFATGAYTIRLPPPPLLSASPGRVLWFHADLFESAYPHPGSFQAETGGHLAATWSFVTTHLAPPAVPFATASGLIACPARSPSAGRVLRAPDVLPPPSLTGFATTSISLLPLVRPPIPAPPRTFRTASACPNVQSHSELPRTTPIPRPSASGTWLVSGSAPTLSGFVYPTRLDSILPLRDFPRGTPARIGRAAFGSPRRTTPCPATLLLH